MKDLTTDRCAVPMDSPGTLLLPSAGSHDVLTDVLRQDAQRLLHKAIEAEVAGCRGTILVRTGFGASIDHTHEPIDYVVADLRAAAELILSKRHDEATPSRRIVS